MKLFHFSKVAWAKFVFLLLFSKNLNFRAIKLSDKNLSESLNIQKFSILM